MVRVLAITSFLIASGVIAHAQAVAPKPEGAIRIATFNASLNRNTPGALVRDLSTPDDVQAANVAEIIQRVRPDLLLINEFDYDKDDVAATLFRQNYLAVPHHGTEPIDYPYCYSAPVNTGVPSGVDLDNNGKAEKTVGSRGYGNDALGFGLFPGQYGMTVYSKFPIDANGIRSFGQVLWKTMPGATLPTKPDGSPYYSPEALKVFRLSSKSHWDIPVRVPGKTIHLLVSHPTPPAFDGPEKRNVKRNHDEVRLWADYLSGPPASKYLGGPLPPSTFVLLGDMNADPLDGGAPGTADLLLKHPKIADLPAPTSPGAAESSKSQGGSNANHKGDPNADTADFNDNNPGNLRVDYVLPSKDLNVLGGGVFWPASADPLARLVTMTPKAASSDHRLVFLDITQP